MTATPHAAVAQLAEAKGLNPGQCRFESGRPHQLASLVKRLANVVESYAMDTGPVSASIQALLEEADEAAKKLSEQP